MADAGFVRRLAAYLAAIVPITRLAFVEQRNRIRDGSVVLSIVYGAILDGSAPQGTLRKRWLAMTMQPALERALRHKGLLKA
jgi:hypothetical protein